MGSFDELVDKVEKILAALPIPDDRRVPTRLDAMFLCEDVGIPATWSRGLEHLAAVKLATPKQAKRELEKFHKALCALDDTLFGLSSTALEQLDAARTELTSRSTPSTFLIYHYFQEFYPNLKEAVAEAARRVEDSEPSIGRGRRRKLAPKLIADRLALHYYWLTGMRPTRRTDWDDGRPYGPFLKFVKQFFDLFDVDGSEITFANEAVKDFDQALEKLEQERARNQEEALKMLMDKTHQNF